MEVRHRPGGKRVPEFPPEFFLRSSCRDFPSIIGPIPAQGKQHRSVDGRGLSAWFHQWAQAHPAHPWAGHPLYGVLLGRLAGNAIELAAGSLLAQPSKRPEYLLTRKLHLCCDGSWPSRHYSMQSSRSSLFPLRAGFPPVCSFPSLHLFLGILTSFLSASRYSNGADVLCRISTHQRY
jgi:hypothetical protein